MKNTFNFRKLKTNIINLMSLTLFISLLCLEKSNAQYALEPLHAHKKANVDPKLYDNLFTLLNEQERLINVLYPNSNQEKYDFLKKEDNFIIEKIDKDNGNAKISEYEILQNKIQLLIEEIEDEEKSGGYNFISIFKKNSDIDFWNSIIKNETKILNSVGIQGWGDRGSLYSEIIGGNIKDGYLSFGSTIASKDTISNSSVQSLQRLIGGGGNFVLDYKLPICYGKGKNSSLFTLLSLRSSLDMPILGTESDSSSFNINPSFDFMADLSTDDGNIKPFFYLKIGYFFGSKSFYKNLDTDHNPFYYGQLNLGATIYKGIKISANIPILTNANNIKNQTVVSIQLRQGF